MTQAISLSTCGCIPPRPIDLHRFSLLKYSLTCSSSTKSTYSLLQTFPSSLRPGIHTDQWYLKRLSPNSHSVLQPFPCPMSPWPVSCSAGHCHFQLSSSCHYVLRQGHLAFDIPHQIQFHLGFGFSDCIPAGLDSIPVLLSGYLSLLPRSVCLPFVFEFPCLPIQASCHFCLTSCSLGFAALEFGADSWMLTSYLGPPLPSRALSHGTLLSWSSKMWSSSSALLLPFRIVKSTILKADKPDWPRYFQPNEPFPVSWGVAELSSIPRVRKLSISTYRYSPRLLMPCCAVPAGNIGVLEVFLQGSRPVNVRLLPAIQNHLIYLFFLVGWPTAHTHYNVIHTHNPSIILTHKLTIGTSPGRAPDIPAVLPHNT